MGPPKPLPLRAERAPAKRTNASMMVMICGRFPTGVSLAFLGASRATTERTRGTHDPADPRKRLERVELVAVCERPVAA